MYRQLRITEDFTTAVDGEIIEFEKDELVTVAPKLARTYINDAHIAEYTGKQFRVNTEELDSRVIQNEKKLNTENSDGENEGKEFDFESYVEENTAKEVIADVEENEAVAWLENLRNHDERKTVQEAIEDRLADLE